MAGQGRKVPALSGLGSAGSSSRSLLHRLQSMTPRALLSHRKPTIGWVLGRVENASCCDCSAEDPTWASVNVGCFLCTQCAGVHRSLGSHVSFVKSCKLDDWEEKEVRFMAGKGNDEVNAELEFHVPGTHRKPLATSSRELRQAYIEAKYKARQFVLDAAPLGSKGLPVRLEPVFADADADANAGHDAGGEGKGEGEGAAAKGKQKLRDKAMALNKGMLQVSVMHAKDLRSKDMTNSCFAYCKVVVGEHKQRTRTQHDTNHPLWNETLMFNWRDGEHLKLGVWDNRPIKDAHVGTACVDISGLAPGDPVQLCVPLVSKRKARTARVNARELVVADEALLAPPAGAGEEVRRVSLGGVLYNPRRSKKRARGCLFVAITLISLEA